MQPILHGRARASLGGLALALVAGSAGAATKPVSVVLRPSQIGQGYQLKTRPDSTCVARCVTLDLCGYPFTTEPLRTARAQLDYVHPDPAVQLSNEVVTYRQGGAAKALQEVGLAVATCPRRPVKSTVRGVPMLTYALTRFRDRALLPGSIALRVHVRGKLQGKTIDLTDVYVYQARGDTLSVVYAYPEAGITLDRQLRVGRRAAEASAANLRRAIP